MVQENTGTRIGPRAPQEVVSFDDLKAQVQKLGQFYKALMQEGTDYGVIPGTDKPTLLKPGAELLRVWAGLSPDYEIDSAGSDVQAGIFFFRVKCSLMNQYGRIAGQGSGSCTNLESKYRYRWVYERDLPEGVAKGTLPVKEFENKKTGGKFRKYRLENDLPHDLANTILKMAEKRAFVGAILNATGASRIFTQDVEDMPETAIAPAAPAEGQKPKEAPKAGQPPDEVDGQYKTVGPRDPSTVQTLGDLLTYCLADFHMTKAQVLAEFGVKDVSEISQLPAECYTIIAAVRERPTKEPNG